MELYEELLSKIEVNRGTDVPSYNIFRVLDVQTKEIIMCRFLADLLDPEGQHGCGILFLKLFLQHILKYPVSDALLEHTKVWREYATEDGRRVDIVVQSSKFQIPIEVKINAPDQEGQCGDYYKIARNAPVVYLTKFGDLPSNHGRKTRNGGGLLSPENICCISWTKDVCGCLTKLSAQVKEPMRQILEQFIDVIRDAEGDTEEKMSEKNLGILLKSPEYFSAGMEIEKNMKKAELRLIRLVFEGFRKEMERIAPRYGLELETETGYYSYEEKRHERFFDCGGTYPGLNYVIKRAKFQNRGIQMWFRIEIEHNLLAGICLFDADAEPRDGDVWGCELDEISEELKEEAAQYLDSDVFMPIGWWLTWCWSNGKWKDTYYDDVPDFLHMNDCAIRLVDRENRENFVRGAVRVFEEYILNYLK